MSLWKLTQNRTDAVGTFVQKISTSMNNAGDGFASARDTANIVSLESLDPSTQGQVVNKILSLETTLGEDLDIGLEAFSTATPKGMRARKLALSAGVVAAMAAGNPLAYAKRAISMEGNTPAGVSLVDVDFGDTDYRTKPALEAFDEKELQNYMPYSIAFNVFASRQDEFTEKFYPTTVLPPDQPGIDMTLQRVLVFSEKRHPTTGAQMDFKKRNLIDAAVDPSVLADESTRLVPYRNPDDSTAANFIAEASHGGSLVRIGDVDVPTAPLAFGRTIGLIGLSQYGPLLGNGTYDNHDALDSRIAIDAIYLIPADGELAVKLPTDGLPRSTFQKSPEGNGRDMLLNFPVKGLVINAQTRNISGAVVDEFAAVTSNNWTVRLNVLLTGTANLELGNVMVGALALEVASIQLPDGTMVSTTAGAGATFKAAVEAMVLGGYDPRANRTNSNRRTRGLLLDTTYEVERYIVPLGAPISVAKPPVDSNDASDIKALIAAARQRNSNMGVGKLFRYADQLERYVKGPKIAGEVPNVEGIARYAVTPFFERHPLDMEIALNSIETHKRAEDVSWVLINAIRDVAYRMYRDSRIQSVMDQLTGGSGELPSLIVGTDPVLVRHLMLAGDTRTFGTVFDGAEVVVSQDYRVRNKIILTFGRKNSDGPDALSFGCHAWMPELVGTLQVNRNGSTIRETMVQPRNLHFNNLPVMAIIDVSKLTEVLVDKTPTQFSNTDPANPYLPGITLPTP